MNQDPAKAAKARALVASLLFIESGVVVLLALWLATREFNPGDATGVLWEDNQIVEW